MRLLQLSTAADQVLDLHPNLTVVSGLGESAHRALVEAVTGLARGEAAGRGGLLEAHGVLFDLDPTLVALLDVAAADLDPIVRPGQLPGQPLPVDARELRERERAFAALLAQISERVEQQSQARDAARTTAAALEQARRTRAGLSSGASGRLDEVDRLARRLDQLVEQRRRADEDLAAARPALDALRAAREAAAGRTASVREARDVAVARRAALEEQLEELERAIDLSAGPELERVTAELRRVEAAVAEERARDAELVPSVGPPGDRWPSSDPDGEPVSVRIDALDARIATLDHLRSLVTAVEQHAVRGALANAQSGAGLEPVSSPEAAALADELDRLEVALGDGGDASSEADVTTMADARRRLDDGRQAVLEAEQAVRNPPLDPEEAARLEAAHERYLDASERAEGRLAGARAARRVAALRAAEEEVLERLGFASYSSYRIGHSLGQQDPEREAALERARAELAAAEHTWAQITAATDAALARASLLDRRRELLDHARELLDGTLVGLRPQDALRSLRVVPVAERHAADGLHGALVAAGVDLGHEQPDHEELELIAEAWLEQAEQLHRSWREAVDERAALRAEPATARAPWPGEGEQAASHRRTVAADVDPRPDPAVERLERLEEARARVGVAEDRAALAASSRSRVGALAEDLANARGLERAASDAASGADDELSTFDAELAAATEQVRSFADELARAGREASEVEEALHRLSQASPDALTLDAEVAVAEAAHAKALALLDAEDAAVAALDVEGRAAALEIERLQDIVAAHGAGGPTPAEELEWYVLARLAAHRSVSLAGSTPLLLDDALRGLDDTDVYRLLGRLESTAEAVQIIVVSDDPLVARWAREAGPGRAAVSSITVLPEGVEAP